MKKTLSLASLLLSGFWFVLSPYKHLLQKAPEITAIIVSATAFLRSNKKQSELSPLPLPSPPPQRRPVSNLLTGFVTPPAASAVHTLDLGAEVFIPEDGYTPPDDPHYPVQNVHSIPYWGTPGPLCVQPSIPYPESLKIPLPSKLLEAITNADWAEFSDGPIVTTTPAEEKAFQKDLKRHNPRPIKDRGALMDEQTRRHLNREFVR